MKRLATWAVALVCAASIISGISYLATAPTAVRANLLLAPVGGGSTFQGPGDVLSTWVFWAGNRAFTAAAAAAHNPIMKLKRTSDSHKCDILAASSGAMGNTGNCSTGGDNGTLWTTWCSATVCEIDPADSTTVVYDQSGGSYATGNWSGFTAVTVIDQTTGCLLLNSTGGGNEVFTPLSAAATLPVQPFTYSTIAKHTGQTATATFYANNGLSGTTLVSLGHAGSANTWIAQADAGVPATFTASDNVMHSINFMINAGASTVRVDSTNTALVTGGSNPGTVFWAVGSNAIPPVGSLCEWGMLGGDRSSGFAAMSTNQHTYGGPNAGGF
jgi:hypothetical protein